ncbi:MAG: hypothetical protein V9F04_01215 [Dermatophilaceae bacterium]
MPSSTSSERLCDFSSSIGADLVRVALAQRVGKADDRASDLLVGDAVVRRPLHARVGLQHLEQRRAVDRLGRPSAAAAAGVAGGGGGAFFFSQPAVVIVAPRNVAPIDAEQRRRRHASANTPPRTHA